MKLLTVILLVFSSMPAAANTLYLCFNDIILQKPLALDLRDATQPLFHGPQKSCPAVWVETDETSKNYQNWKMLNPQLKQENCTNWEIGLFSEQRTVFELYLSPKVVAGEKGFVRLAFENLSEYGPAQTKTFLKCIPASEL